MDGKNDNRVSKGDQVSSRRLAYTALGTLMGIYLVGPMKKLPYYIFLSVSVVAAYLAGSYWGV
jgi:hypothetical protein